MALVSAPIPGAGRVSAQTRDNALNDLNQTIQGLHAAGKYAEAIAVAERFVALAREQHGEESTEFARAIGWLGVVYSEEGRYAEAELLHKRALAIFEKAPEGCPPRACGQLLFNFAGLFYAQGRYAEAELLHKRALAIREKALGPDHPRVGHSLGSLAGLYRAQGRYAEAEPLAKRSLAILEKTLGSDHEDVGGSLRTLARLHHAQGRYAEAEPLYKRALDIYEWSLGPADHPRTGHLLGNLADLYRAQGRYADAEPLAKRSLVILVATLGPDHPEVGHSLNRLAMLYFAQRDWKTAAVYRHQSAELLIRRSRRGTEAVGAALVDEGKGEVERASYVFQGLIKATHRLAQADKIEAPQLMHDMFKTAQWAQNSEAATSLAQMAARQAKGDSQLARLVRERQDLVREWQRRDKMLLAQKMSPPDKRNADAEAALSAHLSVLDTRIGEINRVLLKDFPDYAAISRREPLAIGEVQAVLGDDEALLLFLDTPAFRPAPEESFIWVVTKTSARWVNIELGTLALGREVTALRCGLDYTNWRDSGEWEEKTTAEKLRKTEQASRRARCKMLLGREGSTSDPPFDAARAHTLYKALLGPVEDLIRGKHLLVVASGALISLPFATLVAEPPSKSFADTSEDYRKVVWLGLRQPITTLPSVASLEALRLHGKAGLAPEAFIGFGDPVLAGTPNCPTMVVPTSCPDAAVSRPSNNETPVRLAGAASLMHMFRGGLADVERVRELCPLPDTAHELRCVAKSLGVPESQIYLGSRLTESALKKLPLDRYRIIQFATHGLLSGETAEIANVDAEPALVLTPPEKSSEQDDGLLTASEITTLKLNADWVIMSACNTAAGDTMGAETLSGLARAFFYAGARALLVSHWEVGSEAAVKLTTRAFAEMKADASVGRAEAMRRSMTALVEQGAPYEAHPGWWAPFAVVGEGAR